MTITKTICDNCGANDALKVSVFVERKMDAAGSMDNEYESLDLCHGCVVSLCNQLLHRKATVFEAAKYLPIFRSFNKAKKGSV